MDDTNEHHGPASTLGATAMVAAMVEAVAGLALALAPLAALATVASESRTPYFATVLAGAGALTIVWLLRERPLIALPVLVGWPIPTYFLLRHYVSDLGLAFHGEAIAHYFTGFLSAGTGLYVLWEWNRRLELGRRRFAIIGLAAVGIVALLVAHVGGTQRVSWLPVGALHGLGSASLLTAWPIALAVLWPQVRSSHLRWPAVLLMPAWFARIGLTGPHGIVGATLPTDRTIYLGAIIVTTAVALGFIYRPRIPVWVRIGVAVVVAWLCLSLRGLYDGQFGRLEGSFSGLVESFFGFALPYPAYVADWQASLMTVALFFILTTIVTALISVHDRQVGIALALMTLGGLGLSSPHLVLLVGVGALLLLDAGLARANEGVDAKNERGDLSPIAARWTESLSLDPPVTLDYEDLIAVDGLIDGCPIAWRAHPVRDLWHVQIKVGLPMRGRAQVRLVPRRGRAPADDALSRTHRVRGAGRVLEGFGDGLIDALSRLPQANVALWPGGAQLTIESQAKDIDADALVSFARVVGGHIVSTHE